ncbi:Ran-binding protein 1 homolog b-like protein [Tanacetum coccineum]|uniref:Ran-binding protein 1 homolog b-like protein n=1 Tax=Tanacetum coccineum TaxID=301880 RepID=A0ABQ5JCL9_9ASTR
MASTTEHKGAVKDEDTGAHIAPIVKLDEVAVTTGEEHDDDPLFDPKAKLYRFDKDEPVEATRGWICVESRVLIPETTFVGVESRVLIPETTVWDTLVYPSDTLVIRKQKLE